MLCGTFVSEGITTLSFVQHNEQQNTYTQNFTLNTLFVGNSSTTQLRVKERLNLQTSNILHNELLDNGFALTKRQPVTYTNGSTRALHFNEAGDFAVARLFVLFDYP